MTSQAKKYNLTRKQTFLFPHINLVLKKCNRLDPEFCYYYTTHYPNSKGIVGRQYYYKIYDKEGLIGIIGANSPPLNYKKFNVFFEIKNYIPGFSEQFWLNNNIFKIIISKKNRATKILKLFRKTIFDAYYKDYNIFLKGLITFVEPPRTGVIYKADNWIYLGMTQGISVTAPSNNKADIKRKIKKGKKYKLSAPKKFSKGTKKHIFVMKFSKKYKNKYI